jgi:ribosomal protein S12 methylthiotransferase accessory factor
MVSASNSMANVFERAAAALTQGTPTAEIEDEARDLLICLDYLTPPGMGAERLDANSPIPNRAALLRAAAQFKRVFRLQAPEAPGLTFLGGEADPSVLEMAPANAAVVGVSGAGLSLQSAFESCIGEGIEYLSQFQAPQDRLEVAGIDERASKLAPATRRFIAALMNYRTTPTDRIEWIAATRLSDGYRAALPADICLRRDPGRLAISPPFMYGTGCAAGRTFEAASLHGLLELIERDAASLWWRGGRRGGVIPLESEAQRAAAALVAHIRREVRTRRSWLLEITTDLGIPCVAAISSGPDRSGFACGLAASTTLEAAAQSAIMEMCQIELAYGVVEAKRQERGETALNEADLRHLERNRRIDTEACVLLHPVPSRADRWETDESDSSRALQVIVDRLREQGVEVFAVDLTRQPFGVPAVRIVAPGLQLEPSRMPTERLIETITQTGGGEAYTKGVALL